MKKADANVAIKTILQDISENEEMIKIGNTVAEKEVILRNAEVGRSRGLYGALIGGSLTAAVYKLSGAKRPVLAGLTITAGSVTGLVYGAISIRHQAFEDLLSLPDEKSPFAERGRRILRERLPSSNTFLQAVEARLSKVSSFDDPYQMPFGETIERRKDLDQSEEDTSNQETEDQNDTQRISPFNFQRSLDNEDTQNQDPKKAGASSTTTWDEVRKARQSRG